MAFHTVWREPLVNHAYVDASWQEQPDGRGVGGWGLVLLLPGQLPARLQGQLEAPDNNAAELRAVLEALRVAPGAQPLTVHTDNQAVIASMARGRGPHLLTELTREVQAEAQERGVRLSARYAARSGRHMLSAHDLANDARRGLGVPGWHAAQTEVLIEHRAALNEVRLSLRRTGERVTAQHHLDPQAELPPSAQALLAAIGLAQPGETLLVRRASKLAQAMWQKPERALREGAAAPLMQAKEQAGQKGVVIEFLP